MSCTISAMTSIMPAALMYAGHMSMAMARTPARCSGLKLHSTRWASSSLRPGVTSQTRERSTSVSTLGVVVAARKAFLVQAQVAHRLLSAPRQTALDGACNDVVDRVPVQLDQAGHAADARRCLQQPHDEGLHHQRDAAVALSPWHGRVFDATAPVLQTWHLGHDACLEWTRVQMPPFTLDPAVDMRTVATRLGITPHHPLLALHMHRDPVALEPAFASSSWGPGSNGTGTAAKRPAHIDGR